MFTNSRRGGVGWLGWADAAAPAAPIAGGQPDSLIAHMRNGVPCVATAKLALC
jgi:hypothetical protein